MRKLIIYILLLYIPLFAEAQLRYPIVGTYKGKSAQGMAIWDDKAYLFNDGGHCRVLNMLTGEIEYEFDVASAGKNTHVNAACFGKEYINNSKIPILYISEYNIPSRCFVECLNDSASSLVQTIQIKENGKPVFVQSWIPDNAHGCLYAIARLPSSNGEKNSSRVGISKYRLPTLVEGNNIVFTKSDCIDFFVVDFASGTQGGVIKGKKMYLPTGLQESAKGQFNAERAIQVIDLKKKKLVKRIDLTFVATNEPEDIDYYKKDLLLYCGQEGGIYKIKY